MADAVNASQRNVYPRNDGTRFTREYLNGQGITYDESLRDLSWPVCTNVPAIGQKSATTQLPNLIHTQGFSRSKHLLHPTLYGKLRHTDHLSFAKSMPSLGVGKLADPKKPVFDRLYLGSKSQASLGIRKAQGRLEIAGDIAFRNGDAANAAALYTKAIENNPDNFKYEKRCAALAELGRYADALKDAEKILASADVRAKGSALMRVKAIKDYMRRMDHYEAGYHEATSTLVCLLRPREHRQLVVSHPSTFGRPQSANDIGKGISTASSMASLLNWDTDGDGDIDMDELARGVGAMGFRMKKKEKSVFKQASAERGYI